MSEPKEKRSGVKISIRVFIYLVLALGVWAVVFPIFIKAHRPPSVTSCINNLRAIDSAADQFALNHGLTNGTPINFPNDLTPYIKLNHAGKIPSCPMGGVYHISKIGEPATCSLGSTVTPTHISP